MFAGSQSLYSTAHGHAAMMDWYDRALKRLGIDYETLVVPTRFGVCHLLAVGPKDAKPIVLLHGNEGNAVSWRPQLIELQASFRLYALDIIGSVGKSAPTRLAYDNDDHAIWLSDALTVLGIERANLVGISNGSWLIIKLANYAPQRVARAAMLSANGFMPVRFPYNLARLLDRTAVRAMKDALAWAFMTRWIVRLSVSGSSTADTAADPFDLEWLYLLAKYYRFRFPPGPVSDAELAAVTAPTLLLMGEHDQFFPVDAVIERARRLMPHVVAEVVPGASHNLSIENPSLVNARLRAFFSDTAVVAPA